MEKKAICDALKRLRGSRPEFANYTRFAQESGVHRATVESTESGRTLPGVDTIEKWVKPFGLTLSQFFAQFESTSEATGELVRISLGQKQYYGLLTDIFESGQDWYITGIQANLKAMAAIVETQAATSAETGMLSDNEKKKASGKRRTS